MRIATPKIDNGTQFAFGSDWNDFLKNLDDRKESTICRDLTPMHFLLPGHGGSYVKYCRGAP